MKEYIRDNYINKFDERINKISSLYTVSLDHAGCYLCNYENNYICHKFNGGCKNVNVCAYIRKTELLKTFLKEIHWYEQCNKNKGDTCEHGRCQYSVLTLGQESGFFCGRDDNLKA